MPQPQDTGCAIAATAPRLAYPLSEAAHLIGISKAGLYRLAADGKIKLIHVGKRTLVPGAEIARVARDGTA
jgi:excisionase family DNA binding protein